MSEVTKNRWIMAAAGALAGLAAWMFFEIFVDQVDSERLILVTGALLGSFFSAFLVSMGPLPIIRAAIAAVVASVVPSLLFLWASFRFETIENFVESGHPILAFAVLVAVPLPFVQTRLEGKADWRHYPSLFDHAWNMAIRYAVAWAFTGIFWGIVMLSNALFETVGLTIIEDILDIDVVPYLLTGTTLGIALAVVYELRAYVSPYIVLRLLRLLVPLVLVVVSVFVIAVPLRGVSDLFGSLSAGAIMMAMAIASVTLITTAIDRNESEAVPSSFMRGATRVLALLQPVLAGLAAYSIWLRVDQYGWTPDRIAAATIATFVLAYATIYALAVIRRTGWMDHIRRANVIMALLLIAAGFVWMTPILNPQRISANDQFSRYSNGLVDVADVDLWAIGREWGVAGAATVQAMAEIDGEDADLLRERIAELEKANSAWEFRDDSQMHRREELAEILPLYPPGSELDGAEHIIPNPRAILDGCALATAAGNPGCAATFVDLVPRNGPDELLVVWRSGTGISAYVLSLDANGNWQNHWSPVSIGRQSMTQYGPEFVDRILAGEFTVGPARLNSIRIGEVELVTAPDQISDAFLVSPPND